MNELIEQQLRDRFAVGFMFGVIVSLFLCAIVAAIMLKEKQKV